jgi:hypothetical protein
VVVTVLTTVDLLVAPVIVAVDTVIVAVLGTLVTKAEQALERMLAGYLVNAGGVETEATARLANEEVFDEDEDPEVDDKALTFKVVVAVTVDTGILVDVAVT